MPTVLSKTCARWQVSCATAAGRLSQHAAAAAQQEGTQHRTTGDGITTGVVIACWLKRGEQVVDGTAERGKQQVVVDRDRGKASGMWNMHDSGIRSSS